MTDEEYKWFLELLSTIHEIANRIRAIEQARYPAPEAHKEGIRNYQQGWNDAIDFMISGNRTTRKL